MDTVRVLHFTTNTSKINSQSRATRHHIIYQLEESKYKSTVLIQVRNTFSVISSKFMLHGISHYSIVPYMRGRYQMASWMTQGNVTIMAYFYTVGEPLLNYYLEFILLANWCSKVKDRNKVLLDRFRLILNIFG